MGGSFFSTLVSSLVLSARLSNGDSSLNDPVWEGFCRLPSYWQLFVAVLLGWQAACIMYFDAYNVAYRCGDGWL